MGRGVGKKPLNILVSSEKSVVIGVRLREIEDAESRNEDQKVRCRVCTEYSPTDYLHGYSAVWMTMDSFKKSHLKTDKHCKAVALKRATDEAREQERQSAPGFFAQATHVPIVTGPQRRTEFNPYPTCIQTPLDTLMRDFGSDFEIDHTKDELLRNRQAAFTQEVREHGQWAQNESVVHDIGISTPDELMDEDEQDGLLSELLTSVGEIR